MADEEVKKGKKRKPEESSIDPATIEMLKIADEENIPTMFSRADEMKPCAFGSEGSCCRVCGMGPCRLGGPDKEEKTGVCGATIETITARNFARQVAAGGAAHSDHGRDIAMTLIAVAKGEAEGYEIKDTEKLITVAGYFGIETEGKEVNQIALEVGQAALANFGRQEGELDYIKRATETRQKIWRELDLVPRGVDREVVELLHRTHAGTDQDYENILDHTMRCALGDGWGGSMIATDLQDILFGVPHAIKSAANLGTLDKDKVNVVIHGHEPTLAEMIVKASRDPELIELAKQKGAAGINLVGICCTANESLMRQGVAPAGNVLQQELAIMTGAVDAMVVDVQCVFQALAKVAQMFHTELISTSPKAKIAGSTHIPFDHHTAYSSAKDIVKTAINNYPNRGKLRIPEHKNDIIAGFSHEYIRYVLGGKYRASFRPLNDNVMNGRIRGLAAVVGCNNPRTMHDKSIYEIVKSLIANDVLVVATGCAAITSGKYGFLTPEMMENAGPGLREVLETVGIPPVLHMGSCVDNSRILTVLTEVAQEGGLGNDINDIPAVGICPEWYSEKALCIAAYCVASGAYVLFGGVDSPVRGSTKVKEYMISGWENEVGGKLEFEPDWSKLIEKALAHIDAKRKALKIDVAQERVLYDMEMRRELSV